jgi:hypothetical protein
MAEKSIWETIGNADYRIIYVVIMFLTAYPLWYPPGTPMEVGPNVQNYVDRIREMEPGTVVYITFSGYITMLPDIEPIYLATWKMLFTQPGVKLIIRQTDTDALIVLNDHWNLLTPEETYGRVYGEDYIVLPYISMSEASVIAMTEEIRSMFDEDWNGTPFDDLPIMDDIFDFYDVDWYIGSGPAVAARRFAPYGVKTLCWGTGTGLLPFVPPYYNPEAGPVYGYVGGSSQGGELEKASGFFGDGVKYNDAKNLGIVGIFLFILIGNIAYFGERFSGGS